MLLDLWAYRRASVAPPAGGHGGGQVKSARHAALQTDDTMRRAMLKSRIQQDDEDILAIVAAFVRVIQ